MAEQIITKRCSRCKQVKPVSEFYENTRMRDGYYSGCKSCHKNTTHKYQSTEKGKAVQKRYGQSREGKAAYKRYHASKKGKAVKRRYAQSEKGKAAIKKYNQSKKGKTTKIKNVYRYRTIHPERRQARETVYKAIKEGTLPKLDTLKCACGKQAEQYHHNKGYAPEHWLDVIPVCIKCHSKESQSS